ncbi:hypothetical protein CO051_05930 [Candidatus Roizmanbacteria bacterium CG_4_9_14_0_2_um_filter_39_13]|uniref:Phospholipid/glycerol acyltransferase domain-containing protein n=2 Tax=Candidatus Roizmaniibacteriota TaxID=1752723 RepID=A0A2M8EX12_9BACT|nr:MAG: hypothetical protein COY15_04605 [Candidatus Roizmanbacteria bacterium CG_4_10_14_0_2_um_filter_39_12]PJC30403.1 MAG: hypothetical protein CO051_05930 [Candidatus Roizmanbacteria bacterium CG_4_9_14_0_2_um_filter_39_13]PJE61477.1 MAG: hypothetical protein COU87_04270 [Candidatus Roizmanbacteria bacterium CG10_big_fil_rev_8_21_14_0_10_39_12]
MAGKLSFNPVNAVFNRFHGLVKPIIPPIERALRKNLEVHDECGGIHATQRHLACGGSVIVNFAPHTTALDPFIISLFLRHYVSKDHLMAWISSAKFHPDLVEKFGIGNMGPLMHGSAYLEQYYHFSRFPVFQPYMFDPTYAQPIPTELQDEASTISTSSLRTSRKFLEKDASMLPISFEGHRGKSGGMQFAEPAVNVIGKPSKKRDIKIWTLLTQGAHSIQKADRSGLSGLNLSAPTSIIAGPLMSYAEAETLAQQLQWVDRSRGDVTVADAIMVTTAGLVDKMQEIIPGVDPRGVYSWDKITFKS